jgi:hypothetical protein
MDLSQVEFTTGLGVAEQTYRTWDSGRRTPPRAILYVVQSSGAGGRVAGTSCATGGSRREPLDRINDVYARVKNGQVAGRVVIRPSIARILVGQSLKGVLP